MNKVLKTPQNFTSSPALVTIAREWRGLSIDVDLNLVEVKQITSLKNFHHRGSSSFSNKLHNFVTKYGSREL